LTFYILEVLLYIEPNDTHLIEPNDTHLTPLTKGANFRFAAFRN